MCENMAKLESVSEICSSFQARSSIKYPKFLIFESVALSILPFNILSDFPGNRKIYGVLYFYQIIK